MGDIQHKTDVRDRLIAPRDAQHLPSTKGFDDNQKASTEMKLPMYVDPPNALRMKETSKLFVGCLENLGGLSLMVFVAMPTVVWACAVVFKAGLQPYIKPQQPKLENITDRSQLSGNCNVPAHPEHGEYIISNAPTAKPGESFESLKLTVNCLPDYITQNTYTSSGYLVSGTDPVYCFNGNWSHPLPKCVRFCKLDNNTSFLYRCRVNGSIEGYRPCNAYEPSGTVVSPECSRPNYPSIHPSMTCINGSWDRVPDCSQAAHCFWSDVIKKLPASMFVVAAGKIYRDWNHHRDVHAQTSDVKEINIPPLFLGGMTNFHDDVAVVILKTPFEYTAFVGHVCLCFNYNFEKRQLQHGRLGKVAGWGLTAENGNASKILKVVELPYVNITQCFEASPLSYKGHITGDKICAGYGNGTAALCRGDSGGGLVFPKADRYYLRGIVSTATAPSKDNGCNIHAFTTFTRIVKHEHFIRTYL